MKHAVTKKISLIMVLILLLAAFAACGDAMDGNKETTPSINPGQTPKEPENTEEEEKKEEDDTTLVFTLGDLEPLSKEKQEEVEKAWEIETVGNIYMRQKIYWCKNGNPDVVLSHRYYGTYNDCIVIYEMMEDFTNILRGIEVGGQKIYSWWLREVWVYYNGEFITINEAYENKLLTDDDISEIAKYNLLFEELEMGVKYDEE